MNPQVSNDELDPKNPDATMIVAQKILTGIPFSQTFRMKRDILLESELDFLANEIKVRMETWVFSERLAEDSYTENCQFWSPSTTWQMFKETHKNKWWFGWFVRRHPIRKTAQSEYVTIQVDRCIIYPDAVDINFPKLGLPIPYESIQRIYED